MCNSNASVDQIENGEDRADGNDGTQNERVTSLSDGDALGQTTKCYNCNMYSVFLYYVY